MHTHRHGARLADSGQQKLALASKSLRSDRENHANEYLTGLIFDKILFFTTKMLYIHFKKLVNKKNFHCQEVVENFLNFILVL